MKAGFLQEEVEVDEEIVVPDGIERERNSTSLSTQQGLGVPQDSNKYAPNSWKISPVIQKT